MQKENVLVLAQLLANMRSTVASLDQAVRNKDVEHVAQIKREILEIQARIDHML